MLMYSTSEVQHVPDKQRCLLWNIYTLVKVKFIMKHYTQDRNLTVKIACLNANQIVQSI